VTRRGATDRGLGAPTVDVSEAGHQVTSSRDETEDRSAVGVIFRAGVTSDRCVKVPAALVGVATKGSARRFPHAVRVVDPSVERGERLRIVELGPRFVQFTIVDL
jgi:hypothetical protein